MGGSAGKPPADAHDAGLDGADLAESLAADGHDAGLVGAVLPQSPQLMLMMLAWMGRLCLKAPS